MLVRKRQIHISKSTIILGSTQRYTRQNADGKGLITTLLELGLLEQHPCYLMLDPREQIDADILAVARIHSEPQFIPYDSIGFWNHFMEPNRDISTYLAQGSSLESREEAFTNLFEGWLKYYPDLSKYFFDCLRTTLDVFDRTMVTAPIVRESKPGKFSIEDPTGDCLRIIRSKLSTQKESNLLSFIEKTNNSGAWSRCGFVCNPNLEPNISVIEYSLPKPTFSYSYDSLASLGTCITEIFSDSKSLTNSTPIWITGDQLRWQTVIASYLNENAIGSWSSTFFPDFIFGRHELGSLMLSLTFNSEKPRLIISLNKSQNPKLLLVIRTRRSE